MSEIKKIAIEAIKKAGKRLLKEYKSFNRESVKLKSKYEIVTKADLISEKIIINAISRNFPVHRILSEESGRTKNKSDYLWIIDPLDGTTNFSFHNPLWSVSIGLAYKDELILGLIYAPVQDELFIAEKTKGARLNGKKIKVSKSKEKKLIHAFCHGQQERDIKLALKYYNYQKLHSFDCRQLGSAAIELAYVACGRLESIMIPGAHSWDVAGGILMVREAGGKVTDFKGNDWALDSRDMLASNGKEHKKLLEAINR
ncbi:inositol monophosphatase [Candidatus Parcubacteria bacterium]|nr:inositol monophosphatase [Candidatus Parcubacteria bacterium]